MRKMCTYVDRCRCAVVIWLWHKFFRLWGKLCTMRWGKIIDCGKITIHIRTSTDFEGYLWSDINKNNFLQIIDHER